MKRYLSAALLALAYLQGAAQIEWLDTEHDFGAFHEADGPAGFDFRFINRGSEPVAIIGARANCGCTTPHYPVEAIAPGDTAAVSVAYDPAGRPGRFTKYVQVEVSDQPRARLTITGVVIGEESSIGSQYPADFGPLKLRRGSMMVGQVEKGRLKTANVSMYNSTADSLRPIFTGMPDYIDLALVPEVIPPGEQATLMAYFRGSKCPLYGLVENEITIVPDPARPEQSYILPVTAIVQENFGNLSSQQLEKAPVASLGADNLNLGTVAAGKPAGGYVRLDNRGKSTLSVRRVYSTDSGITATAEKSDVKKGGNTLIKIEVDPSQITGNVVNAKVSLITNDPLNPVQTLRVTGVIER